MEWKLGDVGHIIQLSVAPVFLLTGVGTTLGVLTNRLGRIIDRSRVLEERLRKKHLRAQVLAELAVLDRRAHLINRAIGLTTACGLFVCVVIASLFLGNALGHAFSRFVAATFTAAILSLIGGFVFFLREIFVATRTTASRAGRRL